jgi:hypothetical protein
MATPLNTPKARFFDVNGDPLSGGKVFTYDAGTTTPRASYTTAAGDIANANPVILNINGEADIWLTGNYKIVLKDSDDVVQWTVDNVSELDVAADDSEVVVGSGVFVENISDLRALAMPEEATVVTTQGYYDAGDGGGNTFNWVETANDADNGGTIINPTGNLAAGRWITQSRTINARQFGARGNGVTDDAARLAAAIGAAQANSGSPVELDEGDFLVVGASLAITMLGVWLKGSGRQVTRLTFDNEALDCITVQGTDSGAGQLLCFKMSDLTINCVEKTGGRALLIAFAARCIVENVDVIDCYTGMELYVTNDITLENVDVRGVVGGAGTNFNAMGPIGQKPTASYGLFWHAPGDGSDRSDQLILDDVVIQCGYSGADGFYWDGQAASINAYNFRVNGTRFGMRIRNTEAATEEFPLYGAFHGFVADGASSVALWAEGGARMQFVNSHINNASDADDQGGADTAALKLDPDIGQSYTNLFQFTNCVIGGCQEDAADVDARDISFVNCTFADAGRAAANTHVGLLVRATAQDIVAVACKTNSWGAVNSLKHGFKVEAGAARVNLQVNQISSPGTSAIENSSTNSSSLINNNSSTFNSLVPTAYTLPQLISSDANVVLSTAQLLAGILNWSGTTADRTATTPTAAQIVAAFGDPGGGKTAQLLIINETANNMDVVPGAGVTAAGNLTGGNIRVPATSSKTIMVRIVTNTVGSEAVTIYG